MIKIDDNDLNCEIISLVTGHKKRVHVNRMRKVPTKFSIDNGRIGLNTIVFAKYNNKPYWPAEIVSTQNLPRVLKTQYKHNAYLIPVQFFSQSDRFGLVKDSDILPFSENVHKFCHSNRKGLRQAIKLALDKISNTSH